VKRSRKSKLRQKEEKRNGAAQHEQFRFALSKFLPPQALPSN
jgi:hypothetical protein